MTNQPGFGWRPIAAGERLPSEYLFYDGMKWVHRRCSPLAGEHWESIENLTSVHVCMTQEEIAQVPMSWELWGKLSVEEKFLYNKPAFEADAICNPVEAWYGVWLDEPSVTGVSLDCPFRPYIKPITPKWYLLKYPNGSVIGFDTGEKAVYASQGQDVELIVTQEVRGV